MRRLFSGVIIFFAVNVYAQSGGPLDGVTLSPGTRLVNMIFSGDVPARAKCFTITENRDLSFIPPRCEVCGTVPKGKRFKIAENAVIQFNAAAANAGTTAAKATVRGFEIGPTDQIGGTKILNPEISFELTLSCHGKKFTNRGTVLPFLYKNNAFKPLQTGSQSEHSGDLARPGQ